jgi:hypothetical protein
MKTPQSVLTHNFLDFQFFSIRNISCPEDTENDRKVYTGHSPISSILNLPTDENVRDYLLEAEGKKRRVPTQVHRAIMETLSNTPHNFSVLNSGVVIVARDFEINEQEKTVRIFQPSIINGSQTQGVLRDFITEKKINEETIPAIHVKFELIITKDEDLIGETSISRNFQNDVMTISIAGRLGQLDELEKSLQAKLPYTKLKKSETKISDDYVKTEKLLQVIAALVPAELWLKDGDGQIPNKVFTYSMKTKCLKDFQEIYKKVKNPSDPEHEKYKRLYEFYLDISAQALELYTKWKTHQGFAGSRLRALSRDDKHNITDIPDGIVFPILASLSVFATKTKQGWAIVPPSIFQDDEIINAAIYTYQQMAGSNPQTMGKSIACYSALYQITSIYKKLTH